MSGQTQMFMSFDLNSWGAFEGAEWFSIEAQQYLESFGHRTQHVTEFLYSDGSSDTMAYMPVDPSTNRLAPPRVTEFLEPDGSPDISDDAPVSSIRGEGRDRVIRRNRGWDGGAAGYHFEAAGPAIVEFEADEGCCRAPS